MEKVKLGVIGLGSIAQLIHIPNIVKQNNIVLSAVSEVKKNRLNLIAEKFSIQNRYTDYRQMLEEQELDAVIIATPTNTHKEIAINCLSTGKDVLVEKPLARTYAEAKEIVDAAKKHKKILMVGMNLRYRPDTMLLRSIINSSEIGDPFYVKCGWIRSQSSLEKWFTQKDIAGGGVIIDLGIHLLDLALWSMSFPEVSSVSCKNFYHQNKEVEDTSISFIKFKDGSLVNIEVSWTLITSKDSFYLNVFGTKGSASLSPLHVVKKIDNEIIDLLPSQSENPTTLFKKSYVNELKSFIGAVLGLNPVISPGEDALKRLKIIEAMYQSSIKNKEIEL
jgi:predicted dehydrogenase